MTPALFHRVPSARYLIERLGFGEFICTSWAGHGSERRFVDIQTVATRQLSTMRLSSLILGYRRALRRFGSVAGARLHRTTISTRRLLSATIFNKAIGELGPD